MEVLSDLRTAVCSDGAPSARNLLVTVFGDALAPRGDVAVSVRSLSRMLASFGVNERLVRTSLSRLVNEGVVAVTPVGRRSYYGVAPNAQEMFANADHKIYGPLHSSWDGAFTIVMIDGEKATPAVRAELRAELIDRGFGVVAPNVLASATVTADGIADLLDADEANRVLAMRANILQLSGMVDARSLAHHVHRLDDLRVEYKRFVVRFGSYSLDVAATLKPEDAFKLRILLVALYRRIVLADPALPGELLPQDWVGGQARRIISGLYRACYDGSEKFIAALAETSTGDLPSTTVGADRFV